MAAPAFFRRVPFRPRPPRDPVTLTQGEPIDVMRTLHDLSRDERSAYNVWQSKLADRTLSAAEHDHCRREIDHILWKGPNAQVLALKAEIAALVARVERLEFHAGLNDAVIPTPVRVDPPVRKGRVTDNTGLHQSVDAVVDVYPPAPETEVAPPVPPPVDDAPKEETRGRKKLRFIPDKNATGGWMLLDREAGEYLDAAPFKTRKEAKMMTDDLNAGRVPSFLRGKVTLDAPEDPAPVDDDETSPDSPVSDEDLMDLGF